jgi:RNA polymerase sigma-70 factor (ECF subfamily)
MNELRRFERARPRLQAIAHRLLGSAAEAEDAVQETWLRLHRAVEGAHGTEIENLDAWLTTVVGRVCLDMLRARTARREDDYLGEPAAAAEDPEQEALLADQVGLALVVVLEALTPAERLAFVLHDLFAVSFDEIAPIVGRTPDAARQLASRARRRVRHREADTPADRRIVDAFLAAARGGEVGTLLTLLDPDVQMRVNGRAGRQGAEAVARYFAGRAQTARPALIDGTIGIVVVAPGGGTRVISRVTIADNRITVLEAYTDPAYLSAVAVVPL